MVDLVSAGAEIAAVIKSYGVFFIVLMALTFMLLAWIVVVMTRLPKSRREWVVSLISTLVGSIAGGGFVIQHFDLQDWSKNMFGAFALGGLYFLCGLPVWALFAGLLTTSMQERIQRF